MKFLFLIFFIISCNEVHHGHSFKSIDINSIKIGSNKEEILFLLGSPTFVNYPKNNKMCYISAVGERILSVRFANSKYEIWCFDIDKNGTIEKIKHHFVENKDIKNNVIKSNISLKKPK